MGNHLDRLAQIIAAALLVQDIPVDLTRGEVGVFVQIFIDKPLIMSQIQVSLRAVFRHKYFAVLVRTHGSRIDIDVRIELLGGDLVAFRLEQTAERSCRNALSET